MFWPKHFNDGTPPLPTETSPVVVLPDWQGGVIHRWSLMYIDRSRFWGEKVLGELNEVLEWRAADYRGATPPPWHPF